MATPIRIGVLISGSGTNMDAIIAACEQRRITGKVVFVGSDNAAAGGLPKARRHGIPTFVVDYPAIRRQFRPPARRPTLPGDVDRDELLKKQTLYPRSADPEKVWEALAPRIMAESKLLEAMKPYPYDLLVLAGFMRILSPYFIDAVNGDRQHHRIMNIHPALLPAFAGVDGYGDTYRYGCKVGGCTVHFVDYGEDTGPIIGQMAFAIEARDTLDAVKKKGLALEWKLYSACIELFAQGRLKPVRTTHRLKNGGTTTRTIVEILPPFDPGSRG
jgi:phosphoribosylglycinamide formyltransferase-1